MATEIISNNIENELLEQFEKADKEKDYDTMKVCYILTLKLLPHISYIISYMLPSYMLFMHLIQILTVTQQYLTSNKMIGICQHAFRV